MLKFIFQQMFEDKHFKLLHFEFCDLEVLPRMIKVSRKRAQLLKTFQTLLDNGFEVNKNLVESFTLKGKSEKSYNTIDLGLRIGGFFSEIGLYNDSATILKTVEGLCKESDQNVHTWRRMLDCYHK